jgi:C-terminal processing protease CtpA/Prc
VNGTPTADVTDEAMANLIDRREGAPNRLMVANAAGQTWEVTVAAERLPLVAHRILDGDIGLLRFDFFPPGKELQAALLAAVEGFEAQGVRAWVLDLRRNTGGAEISMFDAAMLFVKDGVMFSRLYRGERIYTYQAEQHPTKLPVQRPLAILLGPVSASAAEVVRRVAPGGRAGNARG